MNPSNAHIVVGIGELLWDCFPDGRRPGGAPANVAFHATQLGDQGVICSRVGDDVDGRDLLAALVSQEVTTDGIQIDPRLPTGRVTVDASDPARPRYVIHENVAWDAIEFDGTVEDLMDRAAAVCVGSLAQRSATSRATLRRCLDRASGALRVFDVNLRPDGFAKEWIEATLERVEVVKLNEDEVSVLSEMLGTGTSGPAGLAHVLIERFDVDLVCVTRAERGCFLVSESSEIDVPGVPVKVADAVGAGDAFTAALIAARLRDWPLERAARLANEVGALVASREGAMPDLKKELAGKLEAGGGTKPPARRHRHTG